MSPNSRGEELPTVSGVSDPESLNPATAGTAPARVIGDFDVYEKVGEGGMGVVYRAYERSLKRVVALKELSPRIVGDPSAAKRFRRDAVLAAQLSHPNIVSVFHIDPHDPADYFTMEFVQGKSLKQKVESQGFLPWPEAVQIIQQTCEAVQHAHKKNIIHRDIKPSNILLQNHIERVRIIDFGIAQDITGQVMEMTKDEGLSAGTFGYMSPEQNLGQIPDQRTDIFSLGMTLYHMLTGRLAFQASNRQELALAFKEQKPRPPSEINDDVPLLLDHIVMKAISVDRNHRYSDCGEIIADLDRLEPQKARRSVRRHYALLGAGGCALAILLLLLPQVIGVSGPGKSSSKSPADRSTLGGNQRMQLERLQLQISDLQTLDCILLPAGKFAMGSSDSELGHKDDEGPRHSVKFAVPVFMSCNEISQEQFEAVMGYNPSQFKGARLPVESVSWKEAVEFCRRVSEKSKRSVRLPTEAEWEYACRAGTGTPFSSGNTLEEDQACFDGGRVYGDGKPGKACSCSQEICKYPPNGWGLFDMHGNIAEWCMDWYKKGYYAVSFSVDPQGPDFGKSRVIRGGSWADDPAYCRSARRYSQPPDMKNRTVGFRVVVDKYENVAISQAKATATADSSALAPELGIDNDLETAWCGTQVPGWYQIQFDGSYKIEKVGLWFGSHKHTYTLSLSMDGKTWVPVISRRESPTDDTKTNYEVLSFPPTLARYLRADIISTTAPAGHIYQSMIHELKAYAVVEEVKHPVTSPDAGPSREWNVRGWTFWNDKDNAMKGASAPVTNDVKDFGGSVQVRIVGAPGAFTARCALAKDVKKGDLLRFHMAHSALINANCHISIEGNKEDCYATRLENKLEQPGIPYVAEWIADRDYPADTELLWYGAVWPGEATFWFIKLEIVPGR